MLVTNLKAKRSSHSSKSKSQLHSEEQQQQWRERPKRMPLYSGWKSGGMRGRRQLFVLLFYHCQFLARTTVVAPNHCRLLVRTNSDKWPPSHYRCKPQTGSDVVLHYRFQPSPNNFLIFKLIIDNEGTSLSVLTNLVVMRPTVMSKSVVVIYNVFLIECVN